MPGQYFLISPGSRTSWSHNWDPFLAKDAEGNVLETIDSRQWSITPVHTDVSPETPILSNSTDEVVFVEGCRAGNVYELVEAIVTSQAVRDQRSIVLRCD